MRQASSRIAPAASQGTAAAARTRSTPASRRPLAPGWFRRRPAKSAAALCAAAVIPAVVAVAVAPAAAVTVTSPPSTAQQEAGMTPGLPLADPVNLNTVTPRTLRLRLVAEPKLFDISGKKVWGESYDGEYVGPTMHFFPGEHVDLTLVNKLPTATNLHFHGLHVAPSASADNPYISVPPGDTFTYHLYIPPDQPQGTFWYHDHDMCTGDETMITPGMRGAARSAPNCQDIETQIYDGLSGTIIVGDDRALLPPALRHITARTLVLKDMQLTSSGHIVANTAHYSISSGNPTVRLVNGQLRPVLTLRPGQTELWRLANEGADIFYHLRLPRYKFTIIGQDGYPVARATTADTLDLPPAVRRDVLVTASRHPGNAWLETLPINNGRQGDTYPLVKLMQAHVAGQPDRPLPMPVGGLPTALASLAGAHVARYRIIKLSENAAGTVMHINGKHFSLARSIFSTPAVLGTTEQWAIVNETGEVHPFHVHTDHFQVMSINGIPQPYTGEQDVVTVPYKKHGIPGVVVIRIQFSDFAGKVMFHCHIAAHEDAGMMSFINVIAR